MGRVLTLGSLNADVVVRAPGLPAPGATVLGTGVDVLPGGKGLNQAVAAHRAGAEVDLVGCVGRDTWGELLDAFLATEGLGRRWVRRVDGVTGVAVVTVADDGENSIVVVPGANRSDEVEVVALAAVDGVEVGDVVVAQLEVPPRVVARTFEAAATRGAVTILNPSPVDGAATACVGLADIVIVNETEAAALALPDRRLPGQTVVVTRGERSVVVVTDAGTVEVPARSALVVDTTGAGDCFAGVLAAGLATGAEIGTCVEAAVVAAGMQVGRRGAAPAMPTAEEIADATD